MWETLARHPSVTLLNWFDAPKEADWRIETSEGAQGAFGAEPAGDPAEPAHPGARSPCRAVQTPKRHAAEGRETELSRLLGGAWPAVPRDRPKGLSLRHRPRGGGIAGLSPLQTTHKGGESVGARC